MKVRIGVTFGRVNWDGHERIVQNVGNVLYINLDDNYTGVFIY